MPQKNESRFVERLEPIFARILSELYAKSYRVKRGEKLEYQSAFETDSKFETDICIVDAEDKDKPRVVFEFKTSPTTHDVMVYSQKADDHKRLHPQLVYGMIAERGKVVATKLWKHNRHMDFALYLGDQLSDEDIYKILLKCIPSYLDESTLRAEISKGTAQGKSQYRGIFRKTTVFEL